MATVLASETNMKDQIAGFLGELAEELGWTPELEDARVKPERSEPATRKQPTVLTPDPGNPLSLTTPVDRMRAELVELRSTVKHLGAEIIQLRAQMAQLRHLPAPPDTSDMNVAVPPLHDDHSRTEVAMVSHSEAAEPEARPWPPKVASTPAAAAMLAVRESSDATEEGTEIGDGEAQQLEPPLPAVEPIPEPAEAEIDQAVETASKDDAPTVIAVDDPDSALELFPAEPGTSEDDRADGADPTDSASADAPGSTGYMKSLYRRMSDGAS